MTTTTADTRAARTAPSRGRRRWIRPAACALAGMLALTLPAQVGAYPVTVAAGACVFAVLAISTQLISGVAGLPSMGQPAFYGIGAYTAALLAAAGHTAAVEQLPAASAAAAAAAAVTAPLALRTRGTSFLMASFAIQALAATAASQWHTVTGGDNGMTVAPTALWPGGPPLTAPAYLYWYVLTIAATLTAVVGLLLRTRPALLLRGIASNEARMTALGHRVTGHLTLGYVIAAALAGAGGSLLVTLNQYLSPADLGFDTAALALLAAAMGAQGMTGTIVGAILIVAVRDGLGVSSGGATPLLLGSLFLIVAYRQPAQAALHRLYAGRRRP